MKHSSLIKITAGFLVILFFSGCASMGTYNTATQRKEFIFISTAEEVSMGKSIHKKLAKQYKFITQGSEYDRVQVLGKKLAQVSDRQDYMYRFYLIDKDELNAFTIPGGAIYIFSGLLKKLPKDNQLASVIAHEIGHCAAKHTVKKFQAALGYNFLGSLVLGRIGGQAQSIVNLSSNVLSNLIFSAYSRKDEYESDRLGLKYMYLAGYDLKGMVESFEMLQRESKGAQVPTMLRSHPHLKDRIIAVKNEIYVLKSRYH